MSKALAALLTGILEEGFASDQSERFRVAYRMLGNSPQREDRIAIQE
jgi:hypothetical protein